jgi:hypothetical protein
LQQTPTKVSVDVSGSLPLLLGLLGLDFVIKHLRRVNRSIDLLILVSICNIVIIGTNPTISFECSLLSIS